MRNWRRAAPLAAVGAALAVGVASCGGSKHTQTAVPPTPSTTTSATHAAPRRTAPLPAIFEDPQQLRTNPAGTLD